MISQPSFSKPLANSTMFVLSLTLNNALIFSLFYDLTRFIIALFMSLFLLTFFLKKSKEETQT
jgi:hypothetical protein